jgi:hypothetical protein
VPVDADLPLAARLSWAASYALEHLTPPGGGAARFLERGRGELIAAVAARLPAGAPARRAVEEAPDGTAAEFLRRTGRLEPFVLRGAASSWPALREWSLERFAARWPGDRVHLMDQEDLRRGTAAASRELSLAEFAARVAAGEGESLRFSPLACEHPELCDDLDMEWLRARGDGGAHRRPLQLFIAGPGTRTDMHCEVPSTIFVQVRGRKRWRLYAPGTCLFLDPPASRTPYYVSPVDPDAPDAKRWPLFARADSLETVLEPGDVLWIPPFWWHFVVNLTPLTLSASYRTMSLGRGLRASPLLSLLRVFSRNTGVSAKLT